jgi:hypothetical protein
MARVRGRPTRQLTELSEVILAEWYRVLPAKKGDPIAQMDKNALTAAFSEVIDLGDEGLIRHGNRVEAVIDEEKRPLKLLVPLPPYGITSKEELDDYLEANDDFKVGMAVAMLFGCGR